jgi:hypothetical protein
MAHVEDLLVVVRNDEAQCQTFKLGGQNQFAATDRVLSAKELRLRVRNKLFFELFALFSVTGTIWQVFEVCKGTFPLFERKVYLLPDLSMLSNPRMVCW